MNLGCNENPILQCLCDLCQFVDRDISSVKFIQILIVDLPQVDPMNFRVEVDEITEVDLSRLKGFHFRFVPKMRSGVACNWCLRLHLEVNGWRKNRKSNFFYSVHK